MERPVSQHHKDANWSTHSPKLRAMIKAALPLPCVDCGHWVTEDDKWQVGHLPASDIANSGSISLEDVGPSHSRSSVWPRNCNQIAGGKAGAAKTNAKRRQDKRLPEGW
jgi:hypothetical protein